MGYGDVLILVRRRNALFHEIIRALKKQAVPVGGADRLLLSEHIAFQDLLALGRFARFAGDDLTLAALLRSPFCDIDEDCALRPRPRARAAAVDARCRPAPASGRRGARRCGSSPGRGARPRRARRSTSTPGCWRGSTSAAGR